MQSCHELRPDRADMPAPRVDKWEVRGFYQRAVRAALPLRWPAPALTLTAGPTGTETFRPAFWGAVLFKNRLVIFDGRLIVQLVANVELARGAHHHNAA